MNKIHDPIGHYFWSQSSGSLKSWLQVPCVAFTLTVSDAHYWWGGSQLSGQGDGGVRRGQEQPGKVELTWGL